MLKDGFCSILSLSNFFIRRARADPFEALRSLGKKSGFEKKIT